MKSLHMFGSSFFAVRTVTSTRGVITCLKIVQNIFNICEVHPSFLVLLAVMDATWTYLFFQMFTTSVFQMCAVASLPVLRSVLHTREIITSTQNLPK